GVARQAHDRLDVVGGHVRGVPHAAPAAHLRDLRVQQVRVPRTLPRPRGPADGPPRLPDPGDVGDEDRKRTEFVYLLAWPDEATKNAAWTAFMADPHRKEIKRATSARHGGRVGAIEDRVLVPTPYSPTLS